jgi:hypothetical protein
MSIPTKKTPPALKHAGFSCTSVLPGEDATEFEKLRQAIVAELELDGALEDEISHSLAHLFWRKKISGFLASRSAPGNEWARSAMRCYLA